MTSCVLLADASADVGLGHLRRTTVLARALDRAGVRTAVVPVEGQAAGPLADADVVVLDGYELRLPPPEPSASRRPLVVRIDDLGGSIDADVVINHNGYASAADYPGFDGRLLAGLAYLLIDEAFLSAREHRADGSIVISFGGTDRGRWSIPVVGALRARGHAGPIDIVVPDPLPITVAPVDAKVLVAPDMPAVLGRSAVFVGGAGVTAYEAVAAGCRVVVTAIAENQMRNRDFFRASGVRVVDEFDADAMAALALNAVAASGAPDPLDGVIDGAGADRAAAEVVLALEALRFTRG